jgi:hypothetical protein
MENISKNLIDQDEYPMTREWVICVSGLAFKNIILQKSFISDVIMS